VLNGEYEVICPHCKKPIDRTVSKEIKQKALALLKEGYSTRDIQTILGGAISFTTVAPIRKETVTDEIKLGELEFKAEDFSSWHLFPPEMDIKGVACAIANRILKEKLAKARLVYGAMSGRDTSFTKAELCFAGEEWIDKDTAEYTARLVCIEEIKK
jgi:hypothetical protein